MAPLRKSPCKEKAGFFRCWGLWPKSHKSTLGVGFGSGDLIANVIVSHVTLTPFLIRGIRRGTKKAPNRILPVKGF